MEKLGFCDDAHFVGGVGGEVPWNRKSTTFQISLNLHSSLSQLNDQIV